MKTILFPCTNRVHLARQKLLLEELEKHFNVVVVEREPSGGDMAEKADDACSFFLQKLRDIKPDLLLARGDRFEILPIVMLASYMGIPIAHIEGGDLSSVIDGKVRHAISHLSDYHFPTNEDARQRLARMGIPEDRIWNFGSLDVEFATKVEPKRLKEGPYILVAYHPIDGEDEEELSEALKEFESDYEIVVVSSNSDYGRKYGSQSYTPEDYINLIRFASCCAGNSSSFFKEASIFGIPVVNIGARQSGRLRTHNITDVSCQYDEIGHAITSTSLLPRESDFTYYQPGTAKTITNKIREILA